MLNWLSDTLGDMLLLASTADAVKVSKSAEVELLAVVWELRESSSSLSSSPHMDSGEDGIVIEDAFRSAEAYATTEASFCWMGLDFGLVVLLGLSLEALATLGHHISALLLLIRA